MTQPRGIYQEPTTSACAHYYKPGSVERILAETITTMRADEVERAAAAVRAAGYALPTKQHKRSTNHKHKETGR